MLDPLDLFDVDSMLDDDERIVRDTVARFVNGRTVVAAVEENSADVNYRPLQDNLERLRVVSMDPQRYFPVREQSLTAGGRDDDLVVATRTETLDAWVDALSVLGSVERIEPA